MAHKLVPGNSADQPVMPPVVTLRELQRQAGSWQLVWQSDRCQFPSFAGEELELGDSQVQRLSKEYVAAGSCLSRFVRGCKSYPAKKSRGADQWCPTALYRLPSHVLIYFAAWLRPCQWRNAWPDAFLANLMTLLPKPQRGSRTVAKNICCIAFVDGVCSEQADRSHMGSQ